MEVCADEATSQKARALEDSVGHQDVLDRG